MLEAVTSTFSPEKRKKKNAVFFFQQDFDFCSTLLYTNPFLRFVGAVPQFLRFSDEDTQKKTCLTNPFPPCQIFPQKIMDERKRKHAFHLLLCVFLIF